MPMRAFRGWSSTNCRSTCCAPMIYSLFPDARVIFAQRHPCDAVLSCFMQSFA